MPPEGRFVRLPGARRLARPVHLGMYISLGLLGTTGVGIGMLYGSGVRDSLTLDVTLWLHEASYWVSVNLIVVHVAAAVYHRYRADGIWSSMVPVFRERR